MTASEAYPGKHNFQLNATTDGDVNAYMAAQPNKTATFRAAIRFYRWAKEHHPEIVEEWEGR